MLTKPVALIVQVPISTFIELYAFSVIVGTSQGAADPSTHKPTLVIGDGNVNPTISVELFRSSEAVPLGTLAAEEILELHIPKAQGPLDQSHKSALLKEFGLGVVRITPLANVNGVTGTLYPPPAEGLLGDVGTPSKDSTIAAPENDGTVTHWP